LKVNSMQAQRATGPQRAPQVSVCDAVMLYVHREVAQRTDCIPHAHIHPVTLLYQQSPTATAAQTAAADGADTDLQVCDVAGVLLHEVVDLPHSAVGGLYGGHQRCKLSIWGLGAKWGLRPLCAAALCCWKVHQDGQVQVGWLVGARGEKGLQGGGGNV
jgi:hypothetical protein